jgi:transposase
MKIVDTISKPILGRRPLRRQYSAQFNAQVVRESRALGASVAAVALSHGINANIVHRWRHEHAAGALVTQPARVFVALQLESPPAPAQSTDFTAGQDIRVRVRRGVSVRPTRLVDLTPSHGQVLA